jgi:hypothetical protein
VLSGFTLGALFDRTVADHAGIVPAKLGAAIAACRERHDNQDPPAPRQGRRARPTASRARLKRAEPRYDAKLLLELSNGLTYRRGGHVELARRGAEAPPRDGKEYVKLRQQARAQRHDCEAYLQSALRSCA